MKKYICIILRGKTDPIYMPIEKWASILEDEKNLVAYTLDGETEWTGRTLNKLEVVRSEYDKEYSEKMNQRPYSLYRRKSDDTIIKCFEGELPDNFNDYEKIKIKRL